MSDATRRRIDEEQQFIADHAHRRALKLVSEHRSLLEAFARTLLESEVLDRTDIERLVAEHEGVQPPRLRLEAAERRRYGQAAHRRGRGHRPRDPLPGLEHRLTAQRTV